MGGVSASFALIGDVVLAEPGALIGFCRAARDRTDRARDASRGFSAFPSSCSSMVPIDAIVDRRELRDKLANMITLLLKLPVPG